MRPQWQILTLGLLAFSAAAGAAEDGSLAAAAERYAESALALPAGSARALVVDRRVQLGRCESGWQWSFAFGSKTTVQASCTSSPGPQRYVSLLLPTTPANAAKSAAGPWVVRVVRDLPFGHILTEGDLARERLPQGASAPGQALTATTELVGKGLTRPVRSQDIVGRADVASMLAVRRNAMVDAWAVFASGKVGTRLKALADGRPGDSIALQNTQSSRTVYGVVQADGSVLLGNRASDREIRIAAAKVGDGAAD